MPEFEDTPAERNTTNVLLGWILAVIVVVVAVMVLDQMMKEDSRQDRCDELADRPLLIQPTPGSSADTYRAAARERQDRADQLQACSG